MLNKGCNIFDYFGGKQCVKTNQGSQLKKCEELPSDLSKNFKSFSSHNNGEESEKCFPNLENRNGFYLKNVKILIIVLQSIL